MIRPLCLVGIHRPVWVPAFATPGNAWSPPIRKCRDCHRYLGRTHRD